MKRFKAKIGLINRLALPLLLCLLVITVLAGCKRSGSAPDSNQQFEKEIVVTGPNSLKFEMVYIKSGKFIMGQNTTIIDSILNPLFEGSNPNEGPQRKVTITKGFYIGKYKITLSQYCEFLNSIDVNNPNKLISLNEFSGILLKNGKYLPRPETENDPVNTVPWDGADAFCKWLSKKTGRRFRLPTEAEWEFTARGPEGRYYPWGNKDTKPLQHLWESDSPDDEARKTWDHVSVYDVAQKTPFNVTPDGIVGMAGAVGEWVSDYYGKYPNKNEIDPTGPQKPPNIFPWDNTSYKVLRRAQFALTERTFGFGSNDAGIYGFRVVMETEK